MDAEPTVTLIECVLEWIAVATDFPYGHSAGVRRVVGETAELTEEAAASFDALRNEYETLEAEHAGGDDLPEAVDQRLGEIETAIAAFENRPVRFDPAEIARAGIFVSIDSTALPLDACVDIILRAAEARR